MMIEMDIERRRFEELLPFYVNGTLSFDDQQFMQDYLMKFPELQASVVFVENMRSVIKDISTQPTSHATWGRLLNKYQEFHKKPSLTERLKTICSKWGLSPAFAVVLGLFIIQSTAVLELGLFTTSSAYRGLTTQSGVTPHLKISINPTTDFAQLVDLLRKNGCQVVAGPAETGELWIQLEEPEKLNVIKVDLLNSGLVDEVLLTVPGTDK
jgi:hypothetical protein